MHFFAFIDLSLFVFIFSFFPFQVANCLIMTICHRCLLQCQVVCFYLIAFNRLHDLFCVILRGFNLFLSGRQRFNECFKSNAGYTSASPAPERRPSRQGSHPPVVLTPEPNSRQGAAAAAAAAMAAAAHSAQPG